MNFNTFEKPLCHKKQVSRFFILVDEMVTKTVTKSKFSRINDRRFYFPDAIVSRPFGHPNLNEIDDFMQKGAKKLKNTSGKKRVLFEFRKKRIKKRFKALLVPSNFNVCSETV